MRSGDDMSTSTKRPRVMRACEGCGREFSARVSDVALGIGKFCSRLCQRATLARRNSLARSIGITQAERERIWPNVTRARRLANKAIVRREPKRKRGKSYGRLLTNSRSADSSMSKPQITNHILQNYIQIPETGCWIWLGGWSPCKYGVINKNGKQYAAHRTFYRHFVGSIPDGLQIMHKCDTPPCVNPDHLLPGTHAENMADAWRKGRMSNRHKNRKHREQP